MFRSWFHLYVTVLQNKTVAYLGGGWVGNQGGRGVSTRISMAVKAPLQGPRLFILLGFFGVGGKLQ